MSASDVTESAGRFRPYADEVPSRAGGEQRFFLGLFGAYLLITPFHLFPAGMPQLADLLMLLLGTLLVLRGGLRLNPCVRRPLIYASLFVGYTAVVNMVWAMLVSDTMLLLRAAYYPFNFIVLGVSLLLHEKYGDSFIRTTLYLVMLSVFIQIVNAFVFQGQSRELSFYKDNQLAYWSLISVSIFFLCGLRVRVHAVLQLLLSISALYLVLLSLSRAALLSLPILYLVSAWRKPRQIVATALILVGLLFVSSDSAIWVDARDNLTRSDSSDVSGRGYERIFDYPQYTFFGAAEGALTRFGRNQKSLHSTVGTIFFSYGIIGLGLFFAMLLSIFRTAGLEAAAFILPAFLFGVTHHGLRFPLAWLLIAIILCIGARGSMGEPGLAPAAGRTT